MPTALLITGLLTMTLITLSRAQSDSVEGTTHSDCCVPSPGTEAPLPGVLEAGVHLGALMSPLHWDNLSLLSFTAYQGYDSNPQLEHLPIGSEVSSFSALVVYSLRHSSWNLDLEYRPFVWVTPKMTYKDFSGSASDFRIRRRFNPNWTLIADEHFHYSPNQQSAMEGRGVALDFGNGIVVGEPFLSSGRNTLTNNVSANFHDQLSGQSTLNFRIDQGYTRLSSVLGSSSLDIPTREVESFGSGVSWSRLVSPRDTLRATYDYRRQVSLDPFPENASHQVASFGWSHLVTPRLTFSAAAGPAWTKSYGGGVAGSPWRTTVHGSMQIFQRFNKGGIGLSFSRSDAFTGVISNNFSNRYNAIVERRLSTRWNLIGTASYVQQQMSVGRNTDGKLGSLESGYLMTRNWSVFAQVRYLSITGGDRLSAPQKVATAGVRWAWSPEKP